MAKCDFASANNLFASEFCKVQAKHFKGNNFIVSPFSLEIILALIKLGAKDATAQEIQKATHLPSTDEALRKTIDACFKSLTVEGAILHTANKIYIKQQLAIKDDFKSVAIKLFRAEIEAINFSNNTEAAQTINKWVEKQTGNKIRNLIDSKSLTGDTSTVLVNALYFQANWLDEFREPTTDVDFYLNAKDIIRVPTMSKTKNYYYCENSALKAKFLKMPLKSNGAFFVIVLPNAKDGLAALETQSDLFSEQKYNNTVEIELSLPKFKVETSLELSEQLKNLAIRTMFSKDADLSGIAGNKGDLVVGSVVQKVFINVDEKGIEAAAATAVQVTQISQLQTTKTIPFAVDHPFIFFLTVNGIVLLAGRVLDPRR